MEETDRKEFSGDGGKNNKERVKTKGLIYIPTGSFFEGFSAPYEFKKLGFSFGSDLYFLSFPEYYTGAEDLEQAKNHFFRIIYSKNYIGYVKLKVNLDYFNSLNKRKKIFRLVTRRNHRKRRFIHCSRFLQYCETYIWK